MILSHLTAPPSHPSARSARSAERRSRSDGPPVRLALALGLGLAMLTVLTTGALVTAEPVDPINAADQPEPPEGRELHEPAAPDDDAPDVAIDREIELAPLVRRLLDDELTSDARRTQLRLFHGQWDALDRDALSLDQRAELALLRYQLDDPLFEDDGVAPLLRATAALRRGEPERTVELLDPADDAVAALRYAQAAEQLGDHDRAIAALRPWRETLARDADALRDAAQLAAAAQAVVMLAHLEGRPANDYQFAMNHLGRAHQQLDALYWPAHLAEAEILIDKDNAPDAIAALQETLALNPSSSEAWYRLGRFAADRFNFENVEAAIDKLREINDQHVLAAKLEAHLRLTQRDGAAAHEALAPALERYPTHRGLIALQAVAAALRYDDEATRDALERHDALAPGSPRALYHVGAYLALARQYPEAEAALRAAIERQPAWPRPHVELGLLLMQSGDNRGARDVLRHVARLDPFNRRAANQLTLVEALLDYAVIETEHFVIRYQPGIDAVLARDVARHVEDLYDDITTIYQHQPERKTQIDIMPDEQWLGVRITGMPDIWTIAAATGDVISLTPPREGSRQRGTFDWANVLRHEYVHTVTLSQTRNRVPHWFTEACAVAEELTGRDYDSAQLLAWALHHDELFNLRDVNWGFIRPQRRIDRPLAYAQSHWMLEFIRSEWGNGAVIALLEQHRDGAENVAAIERVLELDHDAFMERFAEWARDDVRSWGMHPPPNDARVRELLRDDAPPADVAEIRSLIEAHGEHPSLLRLLAERKLATDDADAALEAVARYADARPVDPWAHRQLARLALDAGDAHQAIAALEALDAQEGYRGQWAHQLTRIHRRAGRLDEAADASARALRREPYNASYRELAATIHLQRGDRDEALHHLRALADLEPERAQHHVRLAALYRQLGDEDRMREAAERAREIDPDAPVGAFFAE